MHARDSDREVSRTTRGHVSGPLRRAATAVQNWPRLDCAVHRVFTAVFASSFDILLRGVCGSHRLTASRESVFRQCAEQGGCIFASWHSRLFYLVCFYVRRAQWQRIAMLVSLSRDGTTALLPRRIG